MCVHLGETVGKIAIACLALEIWVRQRWEVNKRIGNVGVERFPLRGAALHEINRQPGDLLVDQPALFHIVDRDVVSVLALAPLHDVHRGRAGRRRLRTVGPESFVGRARNAIPLVEAPPVGQPLWNAAEMPLAERPGRIAGGGKRVRDRDLPARQAVELPAEGNRLTRRLRRRRAARRADAAHRSTCGRGNDGTTVGGRQDLHSSVSGEFSGCGTCRIAQTYKRDPLA
jgi:hypothetical protein